MDVVFLSTIFTSIDFSYLKFIGTELKVLQQRRS